MNKAVCISEETLIKVAVESWHLSKNNLHNAKDKLAVKKLLKQLQSLFVESNVQIIDLTGQEHDTGLAVEVLYTENADHTAFKKEIIIEMISPIVLIDERLVKHGQIITKKIP